MKNRKIIDYRVIASDDSGRLSQLVREWSSEGHELFGFPFVIFHKDECYEEICQAMVKYEE